MMFDMHFDLHLIDLSKLNFDQNMLVKLVNKIDSVNMMVMLDYMMDLLVNRMVMLNLV